MGIIDGAIQTVGYGLMMSMVVGAGVLTFRFTQVGGEVVWDGTKNMFNKVAGRVS